MLEFEWENIIDIYRLFDTCSINMAGYKRVLPYFVEPSGETKYKQEELIPAILIEQVSNNLFIPHHTLYVYHNLTLCLP